MRFRIFILLLLFLFCFIIAVDSGVAFTGPDDQKAVEESEKAVKLLGPDRGAVPIVSKVVDIVGLDSVSFSGASSELKKNLKNLGARQVGTEIQISLSGDVLFDFDKWTIRSEAEETLSKIAQAIKALGKINITVEGHTDSKGSESYNVELSRKRAAAVKKWFMSKGDLQEFNFKTKGYGESKPVVPNVNPDGSDNPEGRARNRRVEIRIGA